MATRASQIPNSTDDKPDFLQQFYIQEDPKLGDGMKGILKDYSSIPEDKQLEHVKQLRDKAWAVTKYPCIGQWMFLDLRISQHPQYEAALERVKGGQRLLDVGCCVGQDIRKLVVDGAPSESISGTELEGPFVDLGYELFRDKAKLKSKFIVGDFFTLGDQDIPAGTFDMVHAGSFFHLFSWDEQVELVSKTIKLLKDEPGRMLFGRQLGSSEANVVRIPLFRSGEAYHHDAESWDRLVQQVSENSGRQLSGQTKFVDVPAGKFASHSGKGTVVFFFTVTTQ